MTLHAAKGLEFPNVLIIGLNDGTLPHTRSFDDPEAMMEERRLLYVGITRAMDRLYLLHAMNRSAYGYDEPAEPSRFLVDIPSELTEQQEGGRRSRKRSGGGSGTQASYRPERWQAPSAPAAARPTSSKFRPGMRVAHPVWGEGMVLNSRLQDDDEIVDIFFEELGLKRVAASLARLEIKVEWLSREQGS
jgi:DNA helicase-2/ATP-dependent DNA helicase PcrA